MLCGRRNGLTKKIAITSNSALSAWTMRRKFAKELQQSGYEIYFIVPYDEKYSESLKEEFYVENIYLKPTGKNIFSDLKSIFGYFIVLRNIKPDILLNYHAKPNIYATAIGGLLGVKVINNVAGLGSVFINNSMLSRTVKFLYRIAFKYSSVVFFQNNDDLSQFTDSKIVASIKAELLPGSGVDLIKFRPCEKNKDKNKNFIFLMISRLILDKGLIEIVEASRILKEGGYDYKVYLLGSLDVNDKRSVSKKDLTSWQEENLLTHVEFTDDVREAINNSDCIILPTKYKEGTPRSLLEACAMGKPVIATNVSGCRDVIDDGKNGFLCEVKNGEDLADKMKKIIELSDAEIDAMGQYAREKMCKEFDEKIVINKYKNAINRII